MTPDVYIVCLLIVPILLVSLLYWRKDQQNAKTLELLKQVVLANIEAVDSLRDGDKRLTQMLECVQQNSEAMVGVQMAVEQNSQLLQRLNIDYNARLEAVTEAVRAARRNGQTNGGQQPAPKT
jgi:hypothetical protein